MLEFILVMVSFITWMATNVRVFEYFYPPWVISDFSLCSKEVVSDMLDIYISNATFC